MRVVVCGDGDVIPVNLITTTIVQSVLAVLFLGVSLCLHRSSSSLGYILLSSLGLSYLG